LRSIEQGTRLRPADSLPIVSNAPDSQSVDPQSLSSPTPDPHLGVDQLEQPDQLGTLEADLDTVEASLAALDADDLDQAEALAGSLGDSEPISEGQTNED